MSSIFQDAHTFIGQVEKDHCGPKDTPVLDNVDVHHLGNSDQEENYILEKRIIYLITLYETVSMSLAAVKSLHPKST